MSSRQGGTGMFRAKQPHSNLAARMGRWSADHWKTATFGWLALVIVAFGIGGQVGVKNVDPNTAGPGESGRMDRILDAGFKQPAGESVLIQSSTAASRRSRLQGRRLGRGFARLEGRGRPERPVPARPGQLGPDLEGRALGARRVRHRRRQGRRDATRSLRSWTRSMPRRRPIRASSSASSATRARRTPSTPRLRTTS